MLAGMASQENCIRFTIGTTTSFNLMPCVYTYEVVKKIIIVITIIIEDYFCPCFFFFFLPQRFWP